MQARSAHKGELFIKSSANIPPDSIQEAISEIVRVSKGHILCVEYFEENQSIKSEYCFLYDYPSLFHHAGTIIVKSEKVIFEKQKLFVFEKSNERDLESKIVCMGERR